MSTQTWEPNTNTSASPLNLRATDNALAHLRTQIEKFGAGKNLRLGIKKSGCSGYKYDIDFVEQPEASDIKQELSDDLVLFVTQEASVYVKDVEIDYAREGLNSSLKFNNPNANNQCGCGESFSA